MLLYNTTTGWYTVKWLHHLSSILSYLIRAVWCKRENNKVLLNITKHLLEPDIPSQKEENKHQITAYLHQMHISDSVRLEIQDRPPQHPFLITVRLRHLSPTLQPSLRQAPQLPPGWYSIDWAKSVATLPCLAPHVCFFKIGRCLSCIPWPHVWEHTPQGDHWPRVQSEEVQRRLLRLELHQQCVSSIRRPRNRVINTISIPTSWFFAVSGCTKCICSDSIGSEENPRTKSRSALLHFFDLAIVHIGVYYHGSVWIHLFILLVDCLVSKCS